MCVLIGSFWPKYILFELQKYEGVIFHDTEKLRKFWRKTKLRFEKRLEKFGKFSPEHLRVSKLGLWWDPFVQSRKVVAEENNVMKVKNNPKFEEELTCYSKTDIRNLRNIGSSTQKSKKIAL